MAEETQPERGPRTLKHILEDDIAMLAGKQNDYASTDDPWINFIESADFLNKTRGSDIGHLESAYLLLGVKISRLKNLGTRVPSNETAIETLRDIRGYCAIIQAMLEEEETGANYV